MKIELGKFVALSYDLYGSETDENGKEELIERAPEEQPFTFIYGYQQILDAFEKQLAGKSKGDAFDFTLSPDEAYGEFDEDRVVDVPKNVFEVDGKFDTQKVYVNAALPMMDTEGNHLYGTVVDIDNDVVKMDFNHPFAGETLHFVGKIVEVRDATLEELNPSQGCGCGCGNDDCGDGCGDGCCN